MDIGAYRALRMMAPLGRLSLASVGAPNVASSGVPSVASGGKSIEDIRNALYNTTGSARDNVTRVDPLPPLTRRRSAAELADDVATKLRLEQEKAKARAAEAENYATEAWLLFRGGDYSGAATASARARELGYPADKLPDFSKMPGADTGPGGDTGSQGQALTSKGIPTWAWVVGGVAVVGAAVYFGRK